MMRASTALLLLSSLLPGLALGGTGGSTPDAGAVGARAGDAGPPETTKPSGSDPSEADGAGLPYQVDISPKDVEIGEPVTLEIRFAHQGDVALRVPEGLSFGKLELIGRAHRYERDDAGRVTGEVFRFRLGGYEPGEVDIPDLPFDYVDSAGVEHHMTIPVGKVRVHSMLENEQAKELNPPPGPMPVVVEDPTLLYVGGILVALLVGVGLGLLIYRKTRGKARPEEAEPPRPPEEVALERLDALARWGLASEDEIKDFYLELTGILREYLEGRFGIDATAMTSSEVMEALYDYKGRPRTPSDPGMALAWSTLKHVRAAELQELFDEADMVEFARYVPEPDDAQAALEHVRSVVERTTMPLAVVARGGQGAGDGR